MRHQQYFLCRCRHSARQTFWGLLRSPVHTRSDALSLPCSLVSVCPGKQNHGDLFQCLQRLPKKAQPWWESADVTLEVLRERWMGLTLASPPRSLAQHHPAITHQQDCWLNISPSASATTGPPWRRLDLESFWAAESGVFAVTGDSFFIQLRKC